MKRAASIIAVVLSVGMSLAGWRGRFDEQFAAASSRWLAVPTMVADVYVDINATGANDGTSWPDAYKSLQVAVTTSVVDDLIAVNDGVYEPITTGNKRITIESVNGAAVTIIDGNGTDRCATLGTASAHANTVLNGFKLTNGFTTDRGGGSYGGTLNNCTLTDNTANLGGGSGYGTLNNCTLTGNTAEYGGGSVGGTLNNCTLSGNTAEYGGGGSYYSTLNNCTLTGNTAVTYGGGSGYGTLNNCTLSGNTANNGGGSGYGTLNNCIVWGNTADIGGTENYDSSTLNYCNSYPPKAGTGNISEDPLFVDATNNDFRLQPSSPCIDAGSNDYVTTATDLDGNPRIVNDTVDMGAYEKQ